VTLWDVEQLLASGPTPLYEYGRLPVPVNPRCW